MSYKSATYVLPEALLAVIQNYIDGAYIYIPRKQENKKSWGEVKNSKQRFKYRNELIFSQYQDDCMPFFFLLNIIKKAL